MRTSSCKYSISDFENRLKHLNNDAVQKHGSNYGKFESANKLSMAEFQRYLDANFPQLKLSTVTLTQAMKEYVRLAIGASLSKINPDRIPGCFEFLGFDFMIDETFKPWLIEVNTNPCLELSNSHLASIIPPMIVSGIHRAVFGTFDSTKIPTTSKQSHETRWEKLKYDANCLL